MGLIMNAAAVLVELDRVVVDPHGSMFKIFKQYPHGVLTKIIDKHTYLITDQEHFFSNGNFLENSWVGGQCYLSTSYRLKITPEGAIYSELVDL